MRGAARTLKKLGETLVSQLMFPPTLMCSSHFLRALQQNRAQSRLFYLLTMVPCIDKLESSFAAKLTACCPPPESEITVPQLGGGNVFPTMNDFKKLPLHLKIEIIK